MCAICVTYIQQSRIPRTLYRSVRMHQCRYVILALLDSHLAHLLSHWCTCLQVFVHVWLIRFTGLQCHRRGRHDVCSRLEARRSRWCGRLRGATHRLWRSRAGVRQHCLPYLFASTRWMLTSCLLWQPIVNCCCLITCIVNEICNNFATYCFSMLVFSHILDSF